MQSLGISLLCSAASLKLGLCWRVARRLIIYIRRFRRRITRQSARLDGRNAAPRTPARPTTRHTAAAAATTLCSTDDAIDATARMQQHNKPRAPTTAGAESSIFVRARASESGRRGGAQTKEPAHALVWFCSRHLHARIMLCVGTFIQGVLPGYRFWGHHETS